MILKKLTFLLFFFPALVFSQYDFSAGMGITGFNNSSLSDYVNFNYSQGSEDLSTFNTAAEFFGTIDLMLEEDFYIGVEYSFGLFSYNLDYINGRYELTNYMHRPSLMVYYAIPGEGYKFKFGAGAGVRFALVEEKLPAQPFATTYNAIGTGFVATASANTLLGGNFYALLRFDIRYDVYGEPESSDGTGLGNPSENEFVNLNSLSFGLKAGVSYFLN